MGHQPQIRSFTVDDIHGLVRAGLFKPDERVELIEGRLYEMSPKHAPHEAVKRRLARAFSLALPTCIAVAVETTLYLADDTFLEPDICLHDDALASDKMTGADVLLLVEVADTSLDFDLQTKAPIYARHDVRCLWVIDVKARVTHVHTNISAQGYADVRVVSAREMLVAPTDPLATVRLADIIG